MIGTLWNRFWGSGAPTSVARQTLNVKKETPLRCVIIKVDGSQEICTIGNASCTGMRHQVQHLLDGGAHFPIQAYLSISLKHGLIAWYNCNSRMSKNHVASQLCGHAVRGNVILMGVAMSDKYTSIAGDRVNAILELEGIKPVDEEPEYDHTLLRAVLIKQAENAEEEESAELFDQESLSSESPPPRRKRERFPDPPKVRRRSSRIKKRKKEGKVKDWKK